MKTILLSIITLGAVGICFGRTRFLAIPLENVQLIEVPERNAIPLTRLPRRAVTTNSQQKYNAYDHVQPQAAESSFEQQNTYNPHEYVDYGAHTGNHGAFGWYADFPVQKDH